jgi:hypothetical protein
VYKKRERGDRVRKGKARVKERGRGESVCVYVCV